MKVIKTWASGDIMKILNIDDSDYLLIYDSNKNLMSINISYTIDNPNEVYY